jgi:hypothetical protein
LDTKIVELSNGFNWGKFLVCRFDETEWRRRSALPEEEDDPLATRVSLLSRCGWAPAHLGVFDLATGEGAFFRPGGNARVDLEKHQVWVCPMFEPFLTWLYRHPEGWQDFERLPEVVMLTEAETRGASSIYGHRRRGPVFERMVTGILDRQDKRGPLTRGDVEAILVEAIGGAIEVAQAEERKPET